MGNKTFHEALFWFKCKCGQIVKRRDTYVVEDGFPMCMKCAYPEPEPRRLRKIEANLTEKQL